MFAIYLCMCAFLVTTMFFGSHGLECHYCSSIGGRDMIDCDRPITKTCHGDENRCITIRVENTNPLDKAAALALNCTTVENCNEEKFCATFNESEAEGSLKSCQIECCEGDLCNKRTKELETPTASSENSGDGSNPNNTSVSVNSTMKMVTTPAARATAPVVQMLSGLASWMMCSWLVFMY